MKVVNKIMCAFLSLSFVVSNAWANENAAAKADRLLNEVKKATGGTAWDRLETLRQRGEITGPARGTYDYLIQMKRVLSIQTQARGAWIETFGWNGKSAWASDGSGQVRSENSDESIADAIGRSYRSAYAFYWPARWDASREYVGERQDVGRTMDVIKVTPKGGAPFELWIDRGQHRIVRQVELTGRQKKTSILSDFQKVNGVMLPFRLDEKMSDSRFDTVYSMRSQEVIPALPRARFASPPPHKRMTHSQLGRIT